MDVIAALEETFAHTRQVVAGIGDDQLGEPTPCPEWSVRDLLEHMVGVIDGLGRAAAGAPPVPLVLADDRLAQFDAVSAAALAAWRTPGALDRIVDVVVDPMPGSTLAGINLLDTATHAWDLATATGQPAELPEPVALAALDASRQIVTPALRPGRFAPEQPTPSSPSATSQLVAFLGRQP